VVSVQLPRRVQDDPRHSFGTHRYSDLRSSFGKDKDPKQFFKIRDGNTNGAEVDAKNRTGATPFASCNLWSHKKS
jgi:hypothetical protein